MNVVGVDQSLTGTGYAYRDGGDLMTGLLDPKTLRGIPRLAFIKRGLVDVIDYAQPGLVVMEQYAFMKAKRNEGSRVFNLGEIGGVVRMTFWERGCNLLVMNVTTIKRLIAGKGDADKGEVIQALRRDYGWTIPNDNEADATAMMLIGEAYLGRGNPALVQAVSKTKKGMEHIRGGYVRRSE